MAQTTEGTTVTVTAVKFGFLTTEEVEKHSVVEVTNPILLDSIETPVTGGLYDPLMGPLNEGAHCKLCGQRFRHCAGHCGRIKLNLPVYNPLLFRLLHSVLRSTCFRCHRFRAEEMEVKKCVSQLEHIIKGDIVEAKRSDMLSQNECSNPEISDGSHESCSIVSSDAECRQLEHLGQQHWTSLQLTEAMSVLNKFLKIKSSKCRKCKHKNPTVSVPFFGWFRRSVNSADHRQNVIGGTELEESVLDEVWESISLEAEDANDAFPGGNDGEIDEMHSNQIDVKKGKGKQVTDKILKQKDIFSSILLPSRVRDYMKDLWENEAQLCSFINNIQGVQSHAFNRSEGYYMFFLDTLLVPPIKFRPPSKGGDSVMEHPQTVQLGKVLQSNINLKNARDNNKKIVARWIDLQQSINVLFDNKTMGQGQKDSPPGTCQLLEKKEGIFRQKMMGKRVNFACRSVISPDPYLAVNEIGIPPHFATRLTYPERVTPWNVDKLRRAIINGPSEYPGATHYVENSNIVNLANRGKASRIALSRKLPSLRGSGKSFGDDYDGKCVLRHLQDGDVVLVNRQPTLHKPGIMAHVVRVLKGEKTIRMHYANCSSYNADFDGDEMNVHFPQDEISRAEGYSIVNANNQYIVPTRGETVRGLIQDHITSAVLLTKRDTFLTRDEYNQLLYSCGMSSPSQSPSSFKPGQKKCVLRSEDEMQIDFPAIWKPEPLWTGKQVITAVLNHITRGQPPFTVEKEGKIPRDYFGSNANKFEAGRENSIGDKTRCEKGKGQRTRTDKSGKGKKTDSDKENKTREDNAEKKRYLLGEETLYILKNDLVRGVIDKAQFGNYGLVHMVQELYGPSTAGNLLSALSRLFTAFLQIHGFTCGVDDLLILEQRDLNMKKILEEECRKNGEEVHCAFLQSKWEDIEPMKLQMEIEKAIRSNGEPAVASLDGMMRTKLNDLVNTINKELFPKGLLKPFPKNCFSLMTTTGAKGGAANFQQVSSLLGQQDLEGKRVPRMASGKTLPCFLPWDCTSRAGGFISDNFLNGLRPQEYYFHCMAGREGLVDTAVKTSRSGYLQRCLIKNLECLQVCYDHTVRDADGSIVQFSYGEDGVDVHHTSFLLKFEALEKNREILQQKFDPQRAKSNEYIKKLPERIRDEAEKFSKKSLQLGTKKHRSTENHKKMNSFMELITNKYFSSLAQPGEPVGVIAAQSVGEPSTQMTLNTFHLAGRGEMNVTLGIPRLQEILMTASSDIKTPMMTCPLQKGRSMDDAKRLAAKLKKVTVADVVESMEVSVVPFTLENHEISSIYKLKIKLYKRDIYPPHIDISTKDCRQTLKRAFLKQLENAIENHLLLLSRISGIKNFKLQTESKTSDDVDKDGNKTQQERNADDFEEEDDDGDDGEGVDDFGFDAQKRKEQSRDEVDYEDGSEDERGDELSDESEKENDRDEPNDSEPSGKSEKDVDAEDVGAGETSQESETGVYDSEDEPFKSSGLETTPESHRRKTKSVGKKKNMLKDKPKGEASRVIFMSAKGLHFEVHFKLTNEPHILLAQIAERTAKKVYIKNSGNIDECQPVTCAERQVIYHGDNPKERKDAPLNEKKNIPALHAAGLDFKAFWSMEDDLDIRYLYSNNIHAMLKTYGVEAARATIIMEIQNVFSLYGIKVDYRHLSVIADFMTFTGSYRPLSRTGRIAESISPFSKMSFETASKFIVEAACHGLTDHLETPSARICLGLPVKLGTGSFDLLQKIEG